MRPLKRLPGYASTVTVRGIAGPQPAHVSLRHIRIDPGSREISDRVELCLSLHVLIWQGIALGDVAGSRRIDLNFMLHFAALF